MDIEHYVQSILAFVRDHEAWTLPIVFALAFGESLAFVSLLVPATVALVGIGALIGASGIEFIPIWISAALGAAVGDWVSYWFGVTFKGAVAHIWPLSRRPDLLARGHRFVERYGLYAVLLGRFLGPLRAVVPLVAGILVMPSLKFQLANFSSAFLWAAVLLAPGSFGLKYLHLA
ncbi:MAG: DedA family protein [Acidobacteriota bacterium]